MSGGGSSTMVPDQNGDIYDYHKPSNTFTKPDNWAEAKGFAGQNPYTMVGQDEGRSGDLADQWAAASDGPGQIDPAILQAIKNGHNAIEAGGRVFADINGQIQEISPYINQFKDWVNSNAGQYSQWQQYAKLAEGQPGRDATILTGAAVAPQTAVAEASAGFGNPTAATAALKPGVVGTTGGMIRG